MTTTTNTVNYRQNGRDAANAEGGAFKRWLVASVAIRLNGPSDSDEYVAARDETRDGYVERGGTANTFKTKLSNCNLILDTFADLTVDQIVREHKNLNRAYKAAQDVHAPKDADGNRLVTPKSADERLGDVRAAIRLALGSGITSDQIRAIVAEEAAKLS